jgi:formylglycine-generating enzyme required for sulfatase activity
MHRLLFTLLLLLFTYTICAGRGIEVTEKSNRIALVIGNANYRSAPLKNSVNDANDMASVLKQKGFAVTLLTDASKQQMNEAIRNFGKGIRDEGVGLFFYAGHGMQVNGTNYLIPVGADIGMEVEIEYESVDANRVLSMMEAAGNDLNMVFLDACRNNPFARSFRSSNKGLATMDAPSGSLLAFATAPGSVAADGDGRNGLFTSHLLKYMQEPGLELTQMMKKVRKQVINESEEKQTPWDVSSLTGDFYFTGGNDPGTTINEGEKPEEQIVQKTPTAASEMESEMWVMVKDSRSITDLEIFLESYPNSLYRKQAVSKLWILSAHSVESIKAYLSKYPNSPFKKTADKKVWDIFNAKNSIEQFELFINEFPNSRFIGFAKLKVSKAKQAEKERREKKRLEKERLEKEKKERLLAKFKESMVLIPAGEFQMGSNESDDEKPIHPVYLDDYLIDQYEVTASDYRKCVNSGGCDQPENGPYYNWEKPDRNRHPINGVDWFNAKKFCEYVGKRLPTEAEWEKAATWKNGRKYKYPSGKSSVSCSDAVMYDDGRGCGRGSTWKVGSKSQEINGTYDMAGNVWEWVSGWYGENYYGNSLNNNPQGPSSGSYRVIRGGGWSDGASYFRGAYRDFSDPTRRGDALGFRCAVSP